MKLGKVFIALLVLFIPIFATAQEEFTRTISAENKVAIFENFKKKEEIPNPPPLSIPNQRKELFCLQGWYPWGHLTLLKCMDQKQQLGVTC